MIVFTKYRGITYQIDLEQGQELSILLSPNHPQPNCFGAEKVKFVPMAGEGWIADVVQGGSVNASVVRFNPHGNGTHVECYGHISKEKVSINEQHKTSHVFAYLMTVCPSGKPGDQIISKNMIEPANAELDHVEALIIRTVPNDRKDKLVDYTNTEPPFLSVELMQYLVEKNIKHLLVDLPSVDPEKDEGKLAAHKTFWNWPSYDKRETCTITEMIYVPNSLEDGVYLLNLQRPSFDLDCAPARPIVFPLKQI